jgi:putative ABC transport system ATP-binding protein
MILALLRRVNRETNQTVLLVTHNAAIGEMADRVLRLRSGQIIDDARNESPIAAEALTW